MTRNTLLGAMCAVFLAACASTPSPTPPATPPEPQVPVVPVAVLGETWISTPAPDDELDSVAAWPTEQGGLWLIATAKSSHRLVVHDGDSGQRLRTVGGPGDAPGQFNRPNGIAVFGDLLFVVERDNRRIQIFELPSFKPLLAFGNDQLKSPYGLWVHETAPNQLELLVTDSFMADFRTGLLPPMEELDQRVKRFRISLDHEGLPHARYDGSFGDTTEAGALRMVESIAGDPAHDRLLIAEEDRRVGSTLRDYRMDGRYRGHSLPIFDADAEGVMLWACTDTEGYWIAVDQKRPTLFRVFDRQTLQPQGTFTGLEVANTDGGTLHAAATARFPSGALFAVHDDQSLAAFDLRDIVRDLHLKESCLR